MRQALRVLSTARAYVQNKVRVTVVGGGLKRRGGVGGEAVRKYAVQAHNDC